MTTSRFGRLDQLYSRIHADSCASLVDDGERPDPFLRNPASDTRFGVTLLIEPDRAVAERMCAIGNEIGSIEPGQYHYPAADLHVTVLDLIGAHETFRRDEAQIETFRSIVTAAANDLAPFELLFGGIILSPTGVLAKGYYRDGLHTLRDRLRRISRKNNADLQERYQSISAHVSLMRFSSLLEDRSRLLRFIEKNAECTIGRMTVSTLTLVIHDWYNRRKEILGRFELAS